MICWWTNCNYGTLVAKKGTTLRTHHVNRRRARPFLCLIMPPCSYLYGGLYGGLYGRAHIIRYFPRCAELTGAARPHKRSRVPQHILQLATLSGLATVELIEHPVQSFDRRRRSLHCRIVDVVQLVLVLPDNTALSRPCLQV